MFSEEDEFEFVMFLCLVRTGGQELNHMLRCITMISLRLLKMNTEDGLTVKSCKVKRFLANNCPHNSLSQVCAIFFI